MEKNFVKKALKEFVAFIFQVIFSQISIRGITCVFGLPFALTRVWFGGNIFSIVFAYAISKFNSLVLFSDLFICFYEIVILTLFYFTKFTRLNKKPILLLNFVTICSNALWLYYVVGFNLNIVHFFAGVLLKVLSANFFYKFFKIFKNKFLFFKFSNLDYLYFSIFIFISTVGIFSFPNFFLHLQLFIFFAILVFACRILPNDKFLVLAISVGVGTFVASNFSLGLLFAAVFCVIMINIKTAGKFVYALALQVPILVVFLIVWKFNLSFLLISIFATIIFLCFKQSFILKLSALFDINSLNLMCESLRQDKIDEIKNKLSLMASTLKNMQRDFKFLTIGKISTQKASKQLAQDVISICCQNCENYKACYCENINKRAMLENLVHKALQQGKLSQDDLLQGLQAYCFKETIILSEINQAAENFAAFEIAIKNEDMSKLIIADELGNFANIFSKFSALSNINVGVSKINSLKLKDLLISNSLDVKEVAIVEDINGIKSINLIAQNEHILKTEMIDTISKFTKTRYKTLNAKHLNYSGLSLATYIPAEKLKMNIAVSSKAKEQANGDNVAMTKLSNEKYFVAIADGMGHGEAACRISSMVLSLIKSMFEIGFDGELVVEAINKLVVPAGVENFTTLDACVIDLALEEVTFIKLGASVSVLKRQHSSELVSGASLPLGIVENAKPTVIKKHLNIGDTIFLASDGVVDSFANVEAYKNYLNDAKIYNLQRFVDDVVFDCEFQNSKHKDDMTIIAINLLKNY